MAELDGLWRVRRVGGLLPPLVGVRKQIRGGRGETRIGALPGVPFVVRGHSLRYRAPLHAFVDELERTADGVYAGRSTFLGRELGRFVMERSGGEEMTDSAAEADDLKAQLVKHIDEAYAMEQNVLRMLDGMIQTTDDHEMKSDLGHHKSETERHAQLLRQRLEAYGASPSVVKEAVGILGALMKGALDLARPEKAGRNARDGFATEHMEIASYELLERVARRAGDPETAEVARTNRLDEEAMARKIAANWDKFVELSLEEAGVRVEARA